MPERIQRKRTKGWRMPDGAVYVGRPTKWGNPWRIREIGIVAHHGRCYAVERDDGTSLGRFATHEDAAYWAARGFLRDHSDSLRDAARAELAGRDLACWCPLDQPCHADVLLELANRGDPDTVAAARRTIRQEASR